MPITTQPTLLKDVSLTLLKSGSATEPAEYRCQLTQAQLTPTAASGGGNTLSTFCADYSDSGGLGTWALDLAGFQAFADAQDFSVLSFKEEGSVFDFVLQPLGGAPSATNPGFAGQVTMVGTQIGGTAKQWAVFTASLPCVQKPEILESAGEVFAALSRSRSRPLPEPLPEPAAV